MLECPSIIREHIWDESNVSYPFIVENLFRIIIYKTVMEGIRIDAYADECHHETSRETRSAVAADLAARFALWAERPQPLALLLSRLLSHGGRLCSARTSGAIGTMRCRT